MRTMTQKIEDARVHATAALGAYTDAHRITGAGNPDPDEAARIGDLIADLLHLAARFDDTPADVVVYRALDHYEHEADPANADKQV